MSLRLRVPYSADIKYIVLTALIDDTDYSARLSHRSLERCSRDRLADQTRDYRRTDVLKPA